MKLNNIDEGKSFDWNLTSQNYAKYRDIYPPQLYEKLRELGVAADGSAWLDIGTGTGILPQNMYNENAVIYGASYHFVFFLFLDAICFSVVLFGFVGHWEGHLT